MSPELPRLPRLPKLPHSPREFGELAQLLFEWPIRRAPRLTLPLCIVAAAIVQTGVVVLFSISYTEPSAKLPLAPRFYFLPADSAAARRLGPWLEAHDPAMFSPRRATAAAVPAPPPLTYRPSYEEPPPPLHPLPVAKEEAIEPPLMPVVPPVMPKGLRSPAAPVTPPAVSPKTAVRWMDDLAARELIDPLTPPPRPSNISGTSPVTLQPTQYQVGIGPEGIPRSCVTINPSGDPASDEAGRMWILSQRFRPAGSTSWGRTLILWAAETPQDPAKPVSKP